MRLTRRALLSVGVVAVAGGLLLFYGDRARSPRNSSDGLPESASSLLSTAAVDPAVLNAAALPDLSPEPRIFESVLIASVTDLQLREGPSTRAYTYNGRIPGPLLEVSEGDQVVIRFRNDLPEETTIHWHGLHIPVDADGSPLDPIAPGEEKVYSFRVPEGSAGTYWYHPHPHHSTARQVALGLYGGIIVRDPADPLPSDLTERLLILSDNRFAPDGSIDLPDPLSPTGRIDRENGREGDILFVNGEVMPVVGIRSGEVQRWRIVNASASRVYRLQLEGHQFLQVGTDGGLFERPVERDELLLANGERAEVLVRATGNPGGRFALTTLPYDRYIPQTRPVDWEQPRDLLALEYSPDPPVQPVALPATLRHVQPLDPAESTATRVITMSQGLINNRAMDMTRVDISAPLGATEIWEVENIVGMDHPFHLHGFQFQVIERNGVPEPFRAWKDTVNVPRHQKVKLIVRYDDHPGKWMFHCHILDHEDLGMMGVLEINQGRGL